MRTTLRALLVILAGAIAASPVRAQVASEGTPGPASADSNPLIFPAAPAATFAVPGPRWYGSQTLLVDALGISATVGGAALIAHGLANNSAGEFLGGLGFSVVGVPLYFYGTPGIHFAHGNPGRGIGSAGLRVLLPIVGFALGQLASGESASTRSSGCDQRCAGGLVGMGFGGGMAALIDATFLAFEAPREPAPVAVSVAPLVLPRGAAIAPQGAGGLALAASF